MARPGPTRARSAASWMRGSLILFIACLGSMLPATAPVGAATATSYAMIGDSITWQATEHLQVAIPGVRIDSDFGRPFSQADEVLVELLAGGVPDILIVALGTNPPLTLSQVEDFMALTGDIDRVVFVNTRIPRDWEAEVNAVINSLPEHFANVSVVDWHGYSAERPYLFNPSGFHLSEQGKPEFANLVAEGAFRAAGSCLPPSQTAPWSAGVGVVDPDQGFWYLRDPLTGDTTSFFYGNPGDRPFMGDWDGDGVDTPGLYRQSDGYVYLRNSNTQGIADVSFFFGNPGDVAVPGDFDGDGFDTVSIYRPAETRFYVINRLGSGDAGLGAAEFDFLFGERGDQPLAGDFDGDGADTVGVYRPSSALVALATGPTTSFYYGAAQDRAVVASFAGGAEDTIGVFRPATAAFHLRSVNSSGVADHFFAYGKPGQLPVAGFFGELPGGADPPSPVPCPFR